MKKLLKTLPILLLVVMASSCTTVRVVSDYDKNADFNNYKTFAFFKTGIDKAEISDLDKRRILRAIEAEMLAKGFTKSESPDVLVSIFTKSREQVNVYNNGGFGPYGYGWGWSPYYWRNSSSIRSTTEGSLYIDLIDANKKELIWQGKGSGTLANYRDIDKKETRIKEFVAEIMTQYPPGSEQ